MQKIIEKIIAYLFPNWELVKRINCTWNISTTYLDTGSVGSETKLCAVKVEFSKRRQRYRVVGEGHKYANHPIYEKYANAVVQLNENIDKKKQNG